MVVVVVEVVEEEEETNIKTFKVSLLQQKHTCSAKLKKKKKT